MSSRTAGPFTGKQAIVTGAGSGIGAALCRALVAAGADVVCTDVDGAAAARTVESLRGPGSATSAILDVTDPAAVKAAVDAVVARAGRLDLMFNNAGIAWGGDTELLTLEQWNAIIDVNIRGVVHGVTAAYPVMLRQGHGFIVNTASMAGLTAAGQITSYVTTKTRDRRVVAGAALGSRSRGVGVLAVCPGAVETPILDKGAIGGFVGRDYYLRGQGMKNAYSADRLARDTLKAIGRNKGLLVKPKQAYASWVFARLAPGLLQRMSIRFIADQRKRQHAQKWRARRLGFASTPTRRAGDEYGIHPHPETGSCGRHDRQPAVRRVLPAQLLRPDRGGRGRSVFVYTAFQLVRSSAWQRAGSHLHAALGSARGDRAGRPVGPCWRSSRSLGW